MGLQSRYVELAAPAALAPYVQCLWIQEIGAGEGTYAQPVLPDGCTDLVVSGAQVLVAGPATTSTTVAVAPGTASVGVRFRTGAASPILGTSVKDFRDTTLPITELWGDAAAPLADRTLTAGDPRAQLRTLVGALQQRLGGTHELDGVAVAVARALTYQPGPALAELAARAGLSERQLRRRVEDAVGYPPRTLARITRFQRFLRAARTARPHRDLARLAADSGYADQPHLTRESKDLTGITPAALLDWEERRMAGTFNTGTAGSGKVDGDERRKK